MLKKLIATSLLASTLAFVGCANIQTTAKQTKEIELLQRKTWIMTHIGSTEYKVNPSARNVPSLQFDASTLRVSGSDGCNRIMGTYTVQGNDLHLGQLASTNMYCMNSMELAGKYSEALDKVTGFQAYGRTLNLVDHYGNVILRFKSN